MSDLLDYDALFNAPELYLPLDLASIMRTGDRMRELLWQHAAMPYVDHDGGDEDDRLVKWRQFERALRQPGARQFRQGDKLYVVQGPDLMRPLVPMRFGDPGDEDNT